MSGIAPWQPALHRDTHGVGMNAWAPDVAQLLALVATGRSAEAAALIAAMHEPLRARVPALPALATAEPYDRAVIHADSQGEILLMHWRSAAVSAIHDHGDAAGLVVALSPYKHGAEHYAHVMLPIAPFTETAGTFVN